MTADRTRWPARRWLVGALLAVVALAGCEDGNVVVTQGDFKVACYKSTVWAGGPGVTVIPKLVPCSGSSLPTTSAHVPLAEGGYIAVDDSGQASVMTLNDCGTIYVFDNGELRTSPCTEIASQGVCALNTQAWKGNCSGELVIETLSASITLQGTWVGLHYASDSQVTLVTVFDGTARVEPFAAVDNQAAQEIEDFFGPDGQLSAEQFPVLEVDDRVDAAAVEQGFAYFTAPDERLGELADRVGFPAREPIPLAVLPQLSVELGIADRLELILEQARLDGIDVGSYGFGVIDTGSVLVEARGGALDDPEVQSALIDAVTWSRFEELVPDGLAAVTTDGEVHDLLVLPESPEAAEAASSLIRDQQMSELHIVWAEPDGPGVNELAKVLLEGDGRFAGLAQLAGGAGEVYGDPEEARQRAAAYAEQGIPAIVLYRLGG